MMVMAMIMMMTHNCKQKIGATDLSMFMCFVVFASSFIDRTTCSVCRCRKGAGLQWGCEKIYVPWSKVAILGMVIPPLIDFNRNPYNGYINPYYWVDEFIPYYMEMSWELIDPIAHIYSL